MRRFQKTVSIGADVTLYSSVIYFVSQCVSDLVVLVGHREVHLVCNKMQVLLEIFEGPLAYLDIPGNGC